MKTKKITANGEFVFISKEETFRIDFKEPFKTIGYCSEIIKDEELANRVVARYDKRFDIFKDHRTASVYNFKKATESFASLLQANDIDLKVGDWLVIKKV